MNINKTQLNSAGTNAFKAVASRGSLLDSRTAFNPANGPISAPRYGDGVSKLNISSCASQDVLRV